MTFNGGFMALQSSRYMKYRYLYRILWNSFQVNATRPRWWLVSTGLVPSGNKPLPEPVLTKIARHMASPWWRHQMETLPALLAICAGKSPVTGEFPTQRPVTRMFSLICVWINDSVNNREAGDLRRYRVHYDVTVMHRGRVTHICIETIIGSDNALSPILRQAIIQTNNAALPIEPQGTNFTEICFNNFHTRKYIAKCRLPNGVVLSRPIHLGYFIVAWWRHPVAFLWG